jgi:hypothetical protein
MYVYIWSRPDGTPFYVGATKFRARTDPAAPMNTRNRTKPCAHVLDEVGRSNVVVTIHHALTKDAAKELEKKLIEQYGRLSKGTGPLTNITVGGERRKETTDKTKALLRAAAAQKNAIGSGEENVAKRPDVRAKMKARWQEPEFKERMHAARLGKLKHTDEFKEAARQRLLDPANPMREQHKVLNTDPTIKAKRTAALRSPEARTNMATKSKAGWAARSPEAKAKQLSGIGGRHSDETRAKMAESARKRWALRRATK